MVLISSPFSTDEASAHTSSEPDLVLARVTPALVAHSNCLSRGNETLREELLHEGRVAAFKAVGRYVAGVGDVDGYATYIAKNRMLDIARAQRIRHYRFKQLTFGDLRLGDTPEPVDEDATKRLINMVDAAGLRKLVAEILTPREREVIEAIYFEEMSSKDTATRIGVSAPRVSRLETVALAKLGFALNTTTTPN